MIAKSGSATAVVLIKAAPQVGGTHGETVCCAGIDENGNWLRLYPISFRYLDQAKRFRRWDRISFNWRLPKDDQRIESRRVDQDSIEIVGSIKRDERMRLMADNHVTSLATERARNRSLALLKPKDIRFVIERKSDSKMAEESAEFDQMRKQQDMFNQTEAVPYSPCPYQFKYTYLTDDGKRNGTCQDWEIEATFFKWRKLYSESSALTRIQEVFGAEYPEKGMLFAMGTHSRYPDVWLINGVLRFDDTNQRSLFL